MARDVLLRLTAWKYVDSPAAQGGPQLRVSSPPPGRSTLTTSAPRSASSIVAYGAARTRLKSAIRTPARAPAVTPSVTGTPRGR